MTPGKGLGARLAGDRERQARLRLFIAGQAQQAQRLLDAEVANEQQLAKRFTAEPERAA